MTFHALGGFALTALVAMVPSNARAASICDATVGNLIQNCGFEQPPEGGDVTPAHWTTSQWGNDEDIQNGTVNSGNWALRIGNDPGAGGPLFDGAAILSQSFSDNPGATYQFTFFLFDGYSGSANASELQFNAYWGTSASPTSGTPVLTDNGGGSPSAGWTKEQFSETGSGSDTITFTGVNGPNFYYLDDVSVVGSAASAPEPGSTILLAFGIVGLAIGLAAARRQAPATLTAEQKK
jgi:hypothetical protein